MTAHYGRLSSYTIWCWCGFLSLIFRSIDLLLETNIIRVIVADKTLLPKTGNSALQYKACRSSQTVLQLCNIREKNYEIKCKIGLSFNNIIMTALTCCVKLTDWSNCVHVYDRFYVITVYLKSSYHRRS